MELLVETSGQVRYVYQEALDFSALGSLSITRASHVEPDEQGQWFANLAPVGGLILGPFAKRSQALAAEQQWLDRNWLFLQR
jgi:hypothetical protein